MHTNKSLGNFENLVPDFDNNVLVDDPFRRKNQNVINNSVSPLRKECGFVNHSYNFNDKIPKLKKFQESNTKISRNIHKPQNFRK